MIATALAGLVLQGSDLPSDRLLDFVANRYSVPGTGGQLTVPQTVRNVPDPQKYIWPKVLARSSQRAEDPWARAAFAQFWKEGKSPSAHAASFYHFGAIGLVRALGQFPNLARGEGEAILAAAAKEAQLELADGTENHRLMWRTSGYLLAEWGHDEPRRKRLKAWIRDWVRRFYRTGNGEWDSSTYVSFSVASFANLYDFAKDREVRNWAKAALDGFAASLALKWVRGAQCGAESRGSDVVPGRSITSILGWLWGFGGPNPPESPNFAHSVIPALSRYRPPAAIVALARKGKSFEAVRTHPDYLMTQGGEATELLWHRRTMGYGVVMTPQGGWAADTQTTLWKWVGGEPLCTITGAGAAYAAKNQFQGGGRSPWDQVVGHGPWVVQMMRLPRNWKALEETMRSMVLDWAKRNDKVRFPELVHEPWAYAAIRGARSVEVRDERLFVDAGDSFAMVVPLNRNLAWDPKAGVAKTSGQVDEVIGFAYRFADREQFASFGAFRDAMVGIAPPVVEGKSVRVPEGGFSAIFQSDGSFTEPLYDWGTPPVWPSGEGYGRVPLRIPAIPIAQGMICDSPVMRWGNGELTITIDGMRYRTRVKG